MNVDGLEATISYLEWISSYVIKTQASHWPR